MQEKAAVTDQILHEKTVAQSGNIVKGEFVFASKQTVLPNAYPTEKKILHTKANGKHKKKNLYMSSKLLLCHIVSATSITGLVHFRYALDRIYTETKQ